MYACILLSEELVFIEVITSWKVPRTMYWVKSSSVMTKLFVKMWAIDLRVSRNFRALIKELKK